MITAETTNARVMLNPGLKFFVNEKLRFVSEGTVYASARKPELQHKLIYQASENRSFSIESFWHESYESTVVGVTQFWQIWFKTENFQRRITERPI